MKNLYFYHCKNEDCEKHTMVKHMQRECTMHCGECGCLLVRYKIKNGDDDSGRIIEPEFQSPWVEPKWWSEYERDLSIESVTRTITSGDATETVSVRFNKRRHLVANKPIAKSTVKK